VDIAMSRSKKNKNKIDIKDVCELIDGYGLEYRIINHYHMHIYPMESDNIYNWYHTTGTVVLQVPLEGYKNNYYKSLGKFTNVEDVINLINKNESKEQSSSSIR
jgi:hypothetical protein